MECLGLGEFTVKKDMSSVMKVGH